MPALLFFLLGLLTCSPGFVVAFRITKFSEIQQCGPFNISFSAGRLPQYLPLTLTILPFNSVPVLITIPNPSWNAETSTGVAITFLPLAVGTAFIASLDDAAGHAIGPVSDTIKIQPSADNSCLTPANLTKEEYTISSALSQCQPFQVTYNSSAHVAAPSVRVFVPRGPSYYLNETRDDRITTVSPFKIASYEMTAAQGVQVVMMFEDGTGYRESSNLTTVRGDSSSNMGCLEFFNNWPTSTKGPFAFVSTGLSGKMVIAVAATIGGVVTVVAVFMGVYAYHHRHRNTWKELKGIEGGPGIEGPPTSAVQAPTIGTNGTLYLANPPYPVERFTTSPLSPYFVQSPSLRQATQHASYPAQGSLVENPPVIPPLRHAAPIVMDSSKNSEQRTSTASSVDIDQIFDLATMYSLAHSPRGSKLLTPESPRTPCSPHSRIAVAPAMNMPMQQEGQQESLPASPLPCVSNFGDFREVGIRESDKWRSWTEGRPARRSSGTYIPALGLAFPEPVITRHDMWLGTGGKGLP